MKMKYAKGKRRKVHTFAVGDFVGVRVPKLDRSSTDSHRLMCVVVQKLGKKYHLYRLRYIQVLFYTNCMETECYNFCVGVNMVF